MRYNCLFVVFPISLNGNITKNGIGALVIMLAKNKKITDCLQSIIFKKGDSLLYLTSPEIYVQIR